MASIVAMHSFHAINMGLGSAYQADPNTVLWVMISALLNGSTVFFTVVSGILVSFSSMKRGWGHFYKSKAIYLVLPYMVFTAVWTLFDWRYDTGLTVFSGSFPDYLGKVFEKGWKGTGSYQLWYIPVLCVMLLLTPALRYLLKSPARYWVLAILLIVPLFYSRSFPGKGLNNVAYFLGPYGFGIWLGARFDERMALLRRAVPALIAVSVAATAAAASIYYYVSIPRALAGGPSPFTDWYESAVYVQRMALCCLILLWFEARKHWLPRPVEIVADYAFTIYFVHAFVIYCLLALANIFVPERPGFAGLLLAGVAMWALALALSVALTRGLTLLTGDKSKMLVGSASASARPAPQTHSAHQQHAEQPKEQRQTGNVEQQLR